MNAPITVTTRGMIRDLLFVLCEAVEDSETAADSAQNDLAEERVSAILAFIDLARRHPLPNKLLPRGDQPQDWLPPGTRVEVLGSPGLVVPPLNLVRVQLDDMPSPVEFPRTAVHKEG